MGWVACAWEHVPRDAIVQGMLKHVVLPCLAMEPAIISDPLVEPDVHPVDVQAEVPPWINVDALENSIDVDTVADLVDSLELAS